MARRRPPTRRLATVLFTDIVGSTGLAAELEDRRWRALLARHHELVRRELRRFRGREIDTAGDGFLATFEEPAAAIRCAWAVADRVREVGLEVRAGLHVGEVEFGNGKVGGIAVHTAARIMALAGPGEVLVSGTLRELAAGSGVRFEDREDQLLKGVPGTWRVFAVIGVNGRDRSSPVEPGVAAERRIRASEPPPVTRRAALVALPVLAIIVALAFIVTGLSGRGDGDAPRAAAPGGVLVELDPATGRLLQRSRLRQPPPLNAPVDLAAGEGAVWAIRTELVGPAAGSGSSVAQLDPETRRVERVIPVQDIQGTKRVAVGARAVWVLSLERGLSGSRVAQLNPATGEILARISFGGTSAGGGPMTFDFPADLAVGEGSVWVVTNRGALVRLDPVRAVVIDAQDVATSASGLASGEGALWIIDELQDTLIRVDPRTVEASAPISIPGSPEFMAVGEGAIWVADVLSGTVVKVDAASGQVHPPIRVGSDPSDMVVAFGSVWVTNTGDGTLSRIDPITGRPETIDLPGPLSPGAIAADPTRGTLWVWAREAASTAPREP